MSQHQLLEPLRDILNEAQHLAALAQSEEWQAMELESGKYQQHVVFLNDELYLQGIIDANLVVEAKEIIAQIQVINDDLDLQASSQRDKIASELRQLMQADKAMNAYGR